MDCQLQCQLEQAVSNQSVTSQQAVNDQPLKSAVQRAVRYGPLTSVVRHNIR